VPAMALIKASASIQVILQAGENCKCELSETKASSSM
jgi:hypothetical protein